MNGKKSQITVFIIAGVVMLIVAGILLTIGGNIKTRKESLYPDALPITRYVDECVKKFTEEAVSHASAQAGYIYSSQGGSVQDLSQADEGKLYLNYGNRKVPYVIRRVPTDDNYPWTTFPELPPPHTGTSYTFPISPSYMQTYRQLERQIEAYIEKKMATNECVNFEADFKQYSIKASKPKTTVTITEKDVFVKLRMPLDASELSTGSRFRLKEFTASKPSALGKFYSIAKVIVEQDNTNFLFNVDEIPEVRGVSVRIAHDLYNKDDAIVLRDSGTGEQFVFARQNRRPALSYISGPIEQSRLSYLRAYDPDEDKLTFSVNGNTVTVSDGQFEDSQSGITVMQS